MSDLIDHLASTLTPVRPRRVSREIMLLGLIALAEVALLFALAMLRRDFGHGMAAMEAWKIAAPGAVAVVATLVALVGASPTNRRVGLGSIGLVATMSIAVGVALAFATPNPVLQSLRPIAGLTCVLAATVLSCPPAIALGLILRRAAPADPASSALAAALAAGAFGATLLGLHCPDDSTLHSLVWHPLGIVVPAIVATLPMRRAARW